MKLLNIFKSFKNDESGAVTVEYGAVGANGTLVMFVKGGQVNATLHAAGGIASFAKGSLFDN